MPTHELKQHIVSFVKRACSASLSVSESAGFQRSAAAGSVDGKQTGLVDAAADARQWSVYGWLGQQSLGLARGHRQDEFKILSVG